MHIVLNLHICQTTSDQQNIMVSDDSLRISSQENDTSNQSQIVRGLHQQCFECTKLFGQLNSDNF